MSGMRLAEASPEAPATVWRIEQTAELVPPAAIDAHVGSRLRARRAALGISQGALGRHLGVTFSQIQKYEKGTNRIGAGRLYNLAALLGVPVQYFFEGMQEPQRALSGRGVPAIDAAEAAGLQDAFARIRDPHTRQTLLSLVASMADADADAGSAER
jgi:transcriptional regulator with XRE-family HTH domain